MSFFCLQLSNSYGARRLREMTMHCNFKENIVYREIIERQSKDFENKLYSVIYFSISLPDPISQMDLGCVNYGLCVPGSVL